MVMTTDINGRFKKGKFFYPVEYNPTYHQSVTGMDISFFEPSQIENLLKGEPKAKLDFVQFLSQRFGRVTEDSRVTIDGFTPVDLILRFINELMYEEDKEVFSSLILESFNSLYEDIFQSVMNHERDISASKLLTFNNLMQLTLEKTHFSHLNKDGKEKIKSLFRFRPSWIEYYYCLSYQELERSEDLEWAGGTIIRLVFGDNMFEHDALTMLFIILEDGKDSKMLSAIASQIFEQDLVIQNVQNFIVYLRMTLNHLQKETRESARRSDFEVLSNFNVDTAFSKACNNDPAIESGFLDVCALDKKGNRIVVSFFIQTLQQHYQSVHVSADYCLNTSIDKAIYNQVKQRRIRY